MFCQIDVSPCGMTIDSFDFNYFFFGHPPPAGSLALVAQQTINQINYRCTIRPNIVYLLGHIKMLVVIISRTTLDNRLIFFVPDWSYLSITSRLVAIKIWLAPASHGINLRHISPKFLKCPSQPQKSTNDSSNDTNNKTCNVYCYFHGSYFHLASADRENWTPTLTMAKSQATFTSYPHKCVKEHAHWVPIWALIHTMPARYFGYPL